MKKHCAESSSFKVLLWCPGFEPLIAHLGSTVFAIFELWGRCFFLIHMYMNRKYFVKTVHRFFRCPGFEPLIAHLGSTVFAIFELWGRCFFLIHMYMNRKYFVKTVHRFFRISLSLIRKGYAIMTLSADYFSGKGKKKCSDM